MDFKRKRISKHVVIKKPHTEEDRGIQIIKNPRKFKMNFSGAGFGIIVSITILILLITGIVKAVGSIDFKFFLKVAGDDLRVDSYDHTNFLILGTGGKNHEGADLTDTIIIASLDQESKLLTMVSIPRDIYVKDEKVGNSKINEIYLNAKNYYKTSTEGLDHMREKIETIMGIPIHYWIKIDFTGFKELVDALGGIDVNVEQAIYDPFYPKDGTYLYSPFKISAGPNHLDGETALKYARSRKTTSDFDRAERQQQIIYAIKEKALDTEILFSQERISEILETLKKNIETNITVKEILTLGSIAADFNPEQISHKLIHDDPTQCGGFLYTPAREFYNGMFVLIPAGGFDFIHLYSDLAFNLPNIAQEKIKIHILNGTKKGGVAGETKQILKRFCFDIARFGNAKKQDLKETTYYYKTRPAALDFIQKLIPGKETTVLPEEYLKENYLEKADLLIELGSDYTDSEKYLKDPFYYLPATKPSTPTETTTPETSTTTSPTPTPSSATPTAQ